MKIKIVIYKEDDVWTASGHDKGSKDRTIIRVEEEWPEAVIGVLKALIGDEPEHEITIELKHSST